MMLLASPKNTEEEYRRILRTSTQRGNRIALAVKFNPPSPFLYDQLDREASRVDILIEFLQSTTTQQTPPLPISLSIQNLNDPNLLGSAEKLVTVLNQLPNLRSLHLDCSLSVDGFKTFANVFQDNQILERLSISQAYFCLHSDFYLRKLFQGTLELQTLSFRDTNLNAVSPETLKAICSKQNLQRLSLVDNKLQDWTIPHIISSTSTNPTLERLFLMHNQFQTTIDFAKMLETNTTLKRFDCDVKTPEEITAFAIALQKNTTLQYFGLYSTNLRSEDFDKTCFLESMKENCTLESFTLSNARGFRTYGNAYISRNRYNIRQKKKTLFQTLLPFLYIYEFFRLQKERKDRTITKRCID